VTAETWAAVGPPDSQVQDCEDDWRARGPVVAAPFDSEPGVAASAKAAATSSSCYMALELHFFSPLCLHSNRHFWKEAHLCRGVHGAGAASYLLCDS
jgi:hypothetical protein